MPRWPGGARVRQSAVMKAQWADPDYRASRVAAATIQWADPAARELASVIARTRWADQAARARMSETMKRNGHRPPSGAVCGRGNGPSPCEALLLAALPAVWKLNHRIAYGTGPGAAYWLDLALPDARIAVECDGKFHRTTAQKARDRRKNDFLMSRGFRVVRVPNERVLTALDAVVAFITSVAAKPAAAEEAQPW